MIIRHVPIVSKCERMFFTAGLLNAVSVLCISAIITMVTSFGGVGAEMTNNRINLPNAVGVWMRPDAALIIDSSRILEYMNGAGELYMAYGFDHLEVYEYTSEQQDSILVEVYFMNTSDDAFGLLSMDWGGEPVTIQAKIPVPSVYTISPPVRALYGGGLLRMRADTIYARVMAYRETEESKEAVLSLGQTIGANRNVSGEPKLLKIFPEAVEPDWTLKNDRIVYFRSHLVLNSLFYLSHQNILQLDQATEAVSAPYENLWDGKALKRVQVLFVRYANRSRARKALSHFHNAYLHDRKEEFAPGVTDEGGSFFNVEDGWLGYIRNGRCLAIVFECPDRKSAQRILKHLLYNAINEEKQHGE